MTNPTDRPALDASAIHAAAVDQLEQAYEGEAAKLLSACALQVEDVQVHVPRSREGLRTVGVTIVAPDYLGRYLQATPEIQGRVRMAFDRSLGMGAYVARFTIQLEPATLLAASA